jgi:hypothetical protein
MNRVRKWKPRYKIGQPVIARILHEFVLSEIEMIGKSNLYYCRPIDGTYPFWAFEWQMYLPSNLVTEYQPKFKVA